MQAVRDGLWPACFSFRMLTACSHEVSLIDDDNTFLSGLLGVYGRFVLTSPDVLSLMHPHWGATLLQIPFSNVKDVLLVREAEGPAGVFKIVLKRMESSKIKAFQFFCNTCKDTIEWILRNAKNIEENNEISERKKSVSSKYPKVKTKTNYEKVNGNFLTSNPSFSTEVPANPYNNTANYYENLYYLKRNIALDGELFLGTNTDVLTSTEYESEISGSAKNNKVVPKRSMKNYSNSMKNINENNGTENTSSYLTTNENIYENIIHGTYSSALITSSFSSCHSDNENEHNQLSNKKQLITNLRLKPSNDGLDTIEHATVNKYTIKNSHNKILETISTSNQNSIIAEDNNKAKLISETEEVDNNKTDMNLHSKWNTIETKSSFSSSISFKKSGDTIFDHKNTDLPLSAKDMLNAPCALQSLTHVNVDKNISKNLHGQNNQLLTNGSIKDYRNNETGDSCLLPNLPSDFLDTSITSAGSNKDTTSRSFIHEEDIVAMSRAADERRNSTFNDSVYEDILDRKGTVYEEIDSSDDEYTAPLPPDLPKRPQNLDIPDSLRLQKLSKNIEQTLKVMDEIKPLTKEHPKLNLVKKIKDVKRIMQISPNSEYAKKAFETETKLPVNGKNNKSLNPLPVNSYVVANKN